VTVTDQLDPNLDWSTFQLGDIGFGTITVLVPPGRTSFSTTVDARATLGVFVDIAANFNPQTGVITWTFTSLDPSTLDLPMDPLEGFLPPNTNAPQGQGFVSYTVNPKAGLATGTKINAQATVTFDTNAPMNTAPLFNTIDSVPPTSSVAALPTSSPSPFTVTWAGQDDAGGSGIASYDVYVSDNGGPFTLFQQDTTATSASFTGQVGHTYGFYSVAVDNVGNRETIPAGAEATTTVAAAEANKLVYTTNSQTLTAGQPSATITVQLEDWAGQLALPPAGGITLTLSTDSSGGTFLDTNGQPIPIPPGAFPTITVPVGATSASFEYQDSAPGAPTLVVSAAAMGAAAQQETVDPAGVTFPVSVSNLSTAAGTLFNGPVGSFTVPDTTIPASSFTATIAWGDHQTSTVAVGGGSGSFTIAGSHTYAQEGRYQLAVTVAGPSGTTGAGFALAHVARVGPPPAGLVTVAGLFSQSFEYYVNFVTAAYEHYLGRKPKEPEVVAWAHLMQQGLTDERLEAGFIGSPEYISSKGAGPGNWAPWVIGMYQDLLGRTPSQAEVNAWVKAINAGAPLTEIAYDFAATPEREGRRVTSDYQIFLGRSPTKAEVDAWVAAFERGYTNEKVIAGFAGSPEYFQKHGDNIGDWLWGAYEDVLGRTPSAGEYQGWLNYLMNHP
jgi:hypothetical protein